MTVPGRPRRAARTGLFIVAGGANFAMMDYKHSAPLEPGRDGKPGGGADAQFFRKLIG
jgi:hypothetical protein